MAYFDHFYVFYSSPIHLHSFLFIFNSYQIHDESDRFFPINLTGEPVPLILNSRPSKGVAFKRLILTKFLKEM